MSAGGGWWWWGWGWGWGVENLLYAKVRGFLMSVKRSRRGKGGEGILYLNPWKET